jgi:hypothetical protein
MTSICGLFDAHSGRRIADARKVAADASGKIESLFHFTGLLTDFGAKELKESTFATESAHLDAEPVFLLAKFVFIEFLFQ